MQKNIVILIPVIAVIAGAALLTFIFLNAPSAREGRAVSENRSMSIEQYVREHISSLSPVEAVLGGTFYVTEISAGNGKGTVHYEDGHIAVVADFTYKVEPEHGAITITSFTVRE